MCFFDIGEFIDRSLFWSIRSCSFERVFQRIIITRYECEVYGYAFYLDLMENHENVSSVYSINK